MKRLTYILFLTLIGGGLFAQVPNNYYNNANGKTGDELKEALHDIIKGHTTIYYSQIWNAFWSTDNKGNGVVWDMYSDIPNGTPPYTFSMGDNQCGEYSQEGDCYNREHSWPQSWFSGDDQATPSRDLHHVFPTDGFVNSQRSNNPYGEVSTASWTSQNGSKLGTCKSSLGYNGTVFEPIDEYKGDFARALMYMSVRYYDEDDDWGSSDMTNKSEILPWAMTMLLRWNDEDPVSQKEIDRNNVIYSDYQHNRNPFIDHPEYARMIWDPNWHGGGNIGNGDYLKVTTEPSDWSGDYLIVYENSGKAFNGALSTLDANNNTISVSISNNQISSADETDAAIFTIAPMTGGYSIKSAGGKYIGYSGSSNGLTASTTALLNTISLSNGSVIIKGTGSSTLQYNSSADRFRYYGSTQNAIQLYKKIETYSITLAEVEHGIIGASAEEAIEGATITLAATPDAGYELDYWTVTDALNNLIEVTCNQFVMPASYVTVSAVFVYVGAPFTQQYHLVTSTDQLVAGRTYLIVNTSAGKALSTPSSSNNNRTAVDISVSNNVISNWTDACELTLGAVGNNWSFFDASWGNNGGYLYAASSGSNYLKTQATNDANGQWSVSIDSNGTATIEAQGTNTRNHLRFNPNNGSPIFSCYASTSNMAKVELYIRGEEYDHNESETLPSIFPFDKHTIDNGVTLMISGTATCNDASQLIIEEGGQLVHHNEGVKATMKKTVQPYTDNGGWYTIAAPFTSVAPAGTMIDDTFDLYAYDEDGDANGKEWINYKSGNFDLAPGQGYLYAHNPGTTLRMDGTLNSGDYTATVDLSYANGSADLKGFNLLGNPVAHDITFTKSSQVSDGYYYLNHDNAWTYVNGNSVPVGRGFMVKANAANQTVTFNPQSKRGETFEEDQYLCLSVGDEKAYVKLNEGVNMPLLDMRGHHSGLYLQSNHQPYIMLVRDDAETLDLCYEAHDNGTQTLTVDTQGLKLDYLHLVDNLTGADVDLLALRQAQGPASYTFETRTTDYANRFKLVFVCGDAKVDNEAFAYYADGEIRLTESCQGASLQIVDMMGRVVFVGDVSGNVSTKGMTPGVYVLHLVSANGVRVQKMVVR